MPIPIEDIEQAVQGSELVSTTYAACDGLVATEGAPYRKLPKDTYALFGHSLHPNNLNFPYSGVIIQDRENGQLWISSGETRIYVVPATEVMVFRADSYIQVQTAWFRLEGDLKTHPSGAGNEIWADGFVEWSEATIKDNIQPLSSSNLLKIEPKTYEQLGEQKAGLIVEDVEPHIPEAIRSTVDDKGNTGKGISWGGVLSHVLYILRNFESRLSALEGVK